MHLLSTSLLIANWTVTESNEQRHDKTNKMTVHPVKTDQTGRMPRLIWVFAGCTVTLLVLSCRGSNALVFSEWVLLRKVSLILQLKTSRVIMNISEWSQSSRITHNFYFLCRKVNGMPPYAMYPRSKACNEIVTFETEGNQKQCDKIHRLSQSIMS